MPNHGPLLLKTEIRVAACPGPSAWSVSASKHGIRTTQTATLDRKLPSKAHHCQNYPGKVFRQRSSESVKHSFALSPSSDVSSLQLPQVTVMVCHATNSESTSSSDRVKASRAACRSHTKMSVGVNRFGLAIVACTDFASPLTQGFRFLCLLKRARQ